jgi:hypothetical protein
MLLKEESKKIRHCVVLTRILLDALFVDFDYLFHTISSTNSTGYSFQKFPYMN